MEEFDQGGSIAFAYGTVGEGGRPTPLNLPFSVLLTSVCLCFVAMHIDGYVSPASWYTNGFADQVESQRRRVTLEVEPVQGE